MLLYNKKYIQAKVKEYNRVIKRDISGDKILKEGVHHACIVCITIDSVLRIEKKKNYPQVYLEECKYKIKKIKMSEFLDAKLESDSRSNSE